MGKIFLKIHFEIFSWRNHKDLLLVNRVFVDIVGAMDRMDVCVILIYTSTAQPGFLQGRSVFGRHAVASNFSFSLAKQSRAKDPALGSWVVFSAQQENLRNISYPLDLV